MSVSAYASVVYGFEAKIKTKKQKVTKYDPDTGAPYKKEIEGQEYLVINGDIELTPKESSDMIDLDESANHLCTHGRDWNSGCEDNCILGVEIVEVGDLMYGNDTQEINMAVPKKVKKVDEFAEKYGVRPKLFLIGTTSY